MLLMIVIAGAVAGGGVVVVLVVVVLVTVSADKLTTFRESLPRLVNPSMNPRPGRVEQGPVTHHKSHR